jgi:myosin heavy subunit
VTDRLATWDGRADGLTHFQELIDGSEDEFVRPLLREMEGAAEAEVKESNKRGGARGGVGGGGDGGKKKKQRTLGAKFRQQLQRLVVTLLACAPSFVRCMKPNHLKVSGVLESPMLLQQLRSLGLLEVCRIRKVGYPARQQFSAFLQRYSVIKPTAVEGLEGDEKAACESLTRALVKLNLVKKKKPRGLLFAHKIPIH